MSDALTYLMNARPDAMKSYFRFIKSAGEHLDPKTRAIISVITKVDNQTESGLRQYLPKALDAGASPDEILDALLYAFPTLGLTKIIWAINILLEMDLPGFRLEQLGRTRDWVDIAPLDDIPDGKAIQIEHEGRLLFIYKSGDDIRVYDNHCPHQGTPIPGRALDGHELTCPKHGWRFDVQTGECIEKGNRPLQKIEYKIENGRLWIYD